MKEVLFKKNFEVYRSAKQRDRSQFPASPMVREGSSEKRPSFELESLYTDKETFVENYGNPLFHLLKEYCMVVVERTSEKVSLKLFYGHRKRNPGVVWFKTYKACEFISVNLKRGNVYVGGLYDYQKKKKFTRKIRCNYFLDSPLAVFQQKLKRVGSMMKNQDSDFYVRPISEFLKAIDGRDDLSVPPSERLFKFFLDSKKIKYPNNFIVYSSFMFGKEFKKSLKKNDNKLVETFMSVKLLKGNVLRKALHEVEFINHNNYHIMKSLYGEQWLNQDYDFLKLILETQVMFNIHGQTIDTFKNRSTKKELRNSFNLIKKCLNSRLVDFYTLSDHFNFWSELKNYGETELYWESDGSSEIFFRNEHLDWADKIEHYKLGHYIRHYPEIYTSKLKSFYIGDIEYNPILLKESSDYNEESYFQSNCVKGYIGRASSIIISLRRTIQEKEERLTVEFRIHAFENSEMVYLDRIQTKAKFNSLPDESWDKPLYILDKVIAEINSSNEPKNFKLTKNCSNGVTLESDTHFDDSGYLVWSYGAIDKSSFIF